jgi:hypothetical protein
MVWGAMIALATIADKKPNEIYAKIGHITVAMNKGTLITLVWGIKALAKVAAADKNYKQKSFPSSSHNSRSAFHAMFPFTLKASCLL